MRNSTKKNRGWWAWVLLAALSGGSSAAWGQCSCTTTVSGSDNLSVDANSTVCIASGTTFSGKLVVNKSGVVICNRGTFAGTIMVNNGGDGIIINNLGTFDASNLTLKAAATLNNGSSDGGTTVVAGATWSGYIGNNIGVAPTINNYATWTSPMQPLPGGTINNRAGATWNAYLSTNAALTIINAGSWSTQVQEDSNSPTIGITHNGGSWTGGIGGGSGSLRLTINAPWSVGFNFPSGASNMLTMAAGITSTFGYLGMAGTVTIINNGTMNLTGGMGTIGAGSTLTNAVGATLALTGDFYNQGTVFNRGTITVSHDFQNYASGVVKGNSARPRGLFKVANYTVNAGSFGADGSYLDFCAAQSPATGFQSQSGTVGPNVTYCSANPLPVTLTDFSAQLRAGQVLLHWTTAGELNNEKFVLERSANGDTFAAIGEAAGQGTTQQTTAYAFTDARPLPGRSYYRLRQVDLSGASSFSPVVSLSRELTGAVPLYPNPVAQELTLDLTNLPAAPCPVRLRNLLGQVLLTQTLAGGQLQALSLSSLPAGSYLLEIDAATPGHSVQRVQKR